MKFGGPTVRSRQARRGTVTDPTTARSRPPPKREHFFRYSRRYYSSSTSDHDTSTPDWDGSSLERGTFCRQGFITGVGGHSVSEVFSLTGGTRSTDVSGVVTRSVWVERLLVSGARKKDCGVCTLTLVLVRLYCHVSTSIGTVHHFGLAKEISRGKVGVSHMIRGRLVDSTHSF